MTTLTRRGAAALIGTGLLAPRLSMGQAEKSARLAYVLPDAHPIGMGAKRFAELVAEKTGNRVAVKTFGSGALGDEVKMISQVQGGVLDLMLVTSSPLANTVKEMGVLDVPFLFESDAEVDAVLEGPVGRKLLAALEPRGIVGLGWMEAGFRNTTNSKRPIRTADDLVGLKIRTMQNKVFIDTFSALGTNPLPLAFTELFSAMETKAVDGAEAPNTVIAANKWNEVQGHVVLTRHAFAAQALCASKRFWESLSEADRRALREAAVEAGRYQRQLNRAQDAEAVAKLRAAGMQVTDLAPAERAALREKVKAVAERVSRESGAALFAEVATEIAKVRK